MKELPATVLFTFAVVFGLSGCASPGTGTPATVPAALPGTHEASLVPVTDFHFTVFGFSSTTALLLPPATPGGPISQEPEMPVELSESVTAMLLELSWTASGQDLDLVGWVPAICEANAASSARCAQAMLHDGRGEGYLAMRGQEHPSLRVELSPDDLHAMGCLANCTWNFQVQSWRAANEVPFTVAITVFHLGAIPDGFTAIDKVVSTV